MMRLAPLAAGLLATAATLAVAAPRASAACRLDAATAAAAGPGCAERWMDQHLHLNDLFTVGTHNSYKQAIPPADYRVIAGADQHMAEALDYAHKALTAKLDAGARQIEIDVVYDPQGGRYAHPRIAALTQTPLDPAWVATMSQPGFKVLHVPDYDVRSSCTTFKQCLGIVRAWSDAHPRHAPITILINAKDGRAAPGGVSLLPFDTAAYDAFDREIRAVLPPAKLITPDDVQGRYPALREAVLHDHWPTLSAARGRILLALDESPAKVAVYRGERRSLEGRVAFINTDERSPAAAYLTLNDPVRDADRIAADVRAGFLVRTRADADTVQARRNDTGFRNRALASGAQMALTDYLWPDPRLPGGFAVRLPDRVAALCNPVRAAGKCGGLPVERVTDADWQRAEAAPFDRPAPRAAPAAAAGEDPRYLAPAALPRAAAILAPPPAAGSMLAKADAAVFHATRALRGTPGWTMALVLAEALPDRATPILARGRAYGESRAVCGSHSVAAVQAGYMAGAAYVAALHGAAAFRQALDAARGELASLRATAPGPDPQRCAAVLRLIAERLW